MRNCGSLTSIRDCCPSNLVFICKGLRSLSSAIHLQKDCGPCLVVFICKGLRSLSSAIHLQKDCGPYPVVFICKGLRPCLVPLVCKGTAVLVFHLLSQQNQDALNPCERCRACKNRCFTNLALETAISIVSIPLCHTRNCCSLISKLRRTAVPAKRGELLSSEGWWEQLFHKLALVNVVWMIRIFL